MVRSFGRTGSGPAEFLEPHTIAFDSRGRLFVGDRYNNRIQILDQSNMKVNPGWKRGIRVGSAKDGKVTAFIPDPEPNPDKVVTSAAEGVAADRQGNIYGAEVGPRRIRKYVRTSS
jgi:hypothetical protein